MQSKTHRLAAEAITLHKIYFCMLSLAVMRHRNMTSTSFLRLEGDLQHTEPTKAVPKQHGLSSAASGWARLHSFCLKDLCDWNYCCCCWCMGHGEKDAKQDPKDCSSTYLQPQEVQREK
jgi:hypothetical protein